MKNIIIVLGNKLINNKISYILEERLKETLCIYKKTKYNIIVSGGKLDKNIVTEASVMKTYLIKNGIPKDKIISESRSKNTDENIRFSYNIIVKHKVKNIIIISSKSHYPKIMKYVTKTMKKIKYIIKLV